ncbi:hypothetical protein UlMin_018320 [Ulmus minor]
MVTKYERKHTCATDFKKVRYKQATSWVVRECVKKRLINPGRVFKPRDVIDDMKRKFGVDISYSVAWRGREYVYENLRLGTPEQSYSLLPGYLHMLRETNPDKFKYLFIAFDASIKGFQYCRPVVSIDATHMKGKYRGVLVMAVCHNANQQIFMLAFGIGDSENDTAWTWFLRRINDVFGERPSHVLVSDRHRSINNAVNEVFPNAFHGICMYHLLNNLKNKFKTKTKELEQHYIQIAKAYNLQEFHVLFYTLCCAVPGAKEYLESVGLDRWTRSHSPSRRYNIMTTNISESMNAALVKIRLLCQRWFFERRNKAKDFTSKMSKDVEKKLEKRRDRAQIMDIRYADEYNFDVIDGDQNFCVDMAVWTCTCSKFQLDQLPCEHALVVVRKSVYEAFDLCSPFYSREYWYESYSGVINPLPHITSWCIPEDFSSFKIMPPDVRTSVGRRRKRRIPSIGEEQSQPKCSHCRESGHNRVTCQNPIALHPSGQTFTPCSTNPSF